MRWVVLAVHLFSVSTLAQPALTSAGGHWLLNPGGERSQVIGTGELLGAMRFRVALQTHLAIENSLQLREHVTAAFAPIDRLQLMAQLPFMLLQRPAPSPEQGVGRPWAGLRVGLLSPEWDDPLWLAIEGHVGIPGLEQAEVPTRSLLPTGLAKVSAGFRQGNDAAIGLEAGSRFGAGLVELEGGVSFAAMGLHWGGELTTRGSLSLLNGLRGFVEVLAGIRYRLRPLELSLLGGPGYGLIPNGFSGRVLFGVSFVNPAPPEDEDVRRRERVADCTDGTPYLIEECPELDRDHDGVLNGVDRCPREPGDPENQGCPWPDRDGDGTADIFDNCPGERGPSNNAGCPPEDVQRVVIKKDRLEILEVIYFEFNRADIKEQSFELLDQIAKVINAHPELAHVRIEGHTDRVGTAEYNRELSLARANTVKLYLVERGNVEGARLSTRGYGFDRPLGNNAAENRRVEFLIISMPEAVDEGP